MRPIDFDPYSLENRPDYSDQLRTDQELLESGAIYVQLRDPRPEEEKVIGDLDMIPFAIFDDAVFYGSPNTVDHLQW